MAASVQRLNLDTPVSESEPIDTPQNSSSTTSSFDADPPSITRIFNDAALYKQVIEDPERASLVLDNESIKDFAELVGKDLDSPEKTLVGRFAQLSVEDLNWSEVGRYTEEPEVYSEEDDSSAESLEKDQEQLQEGGKTISQETSGFPSSQSEIQRAKLSSKLPPDEIIALLKEEFGELASPEIEERLLIETDAALVQDVILLGVMHVTTHRLAFHAALPDQYNDALPGNNVIKSGSAIFHRTGFHRKRRVWLELSQDFLCTFPSASEDDRIRPLKSYQLSSFKEVRPEDVSRPRYIRALVAGPGGLDVPQCVDIEFDTIEASREWRRELVGAIFLYRRKLMAALKPSEAGESDSVKISIPLSSIENINRGRFAELLHFITLLVSTQGCEPETPFRAEGHSTYEDMSGDLQTVQFAVAPFDKSMDCLEALVETSKKHVYSGIGSSVKTKVVVDFASMTLYESRKSKNGSPSDGNEEGSKEKFVCDILGIPYTSDVWMTEARLHLGPITTGYLVVTPQWVGFWSRSITLADERYRIPTSAIRSVSVIDPWLKPLPHYALQLDIQGQSSLRFQFRGESSRNQAVQRVKTAIEQARIPSPPSTPSAHVRKLATLEYSTENSVPPLKQNAADSANSSYSTLARRSSTFLAPLSTLADHPARRQLRMNSDLYLRLPKAVNIPRSMILSMPTKHFVCITIGSRGDVQPYIALGVGLLKEGHRVTIVTHEEYKDWIEHYGISHRTAGGDPGLLMKLSVENKMLSPQFFKESILNFRSWLDQLLMSAWDQCYDAEVILESPYAFAGVHIAEALSIPYFRVCTMPWTKTTQFPHPFISPPVETSKFNSISYVLFDNVLWVALAPQINKWRKEVLGLSAADMSHTPQAKIPIMYNFSSSVVPKPLDWNELAHPCGYWFLDNPEGHDWKPPSSLLAFMAKARSDGKPLVYIGFGSITVPNPTETSQRIFAAVTKSGVRAIISKGWSARMHSGISQDEKEIVPEDCYMLDKVPHDWLFPKVDAALHHGGAGTTSASLRAGIPTLIKPWFGDQYFWASRVQKLGAGLRVPGLRVGDVADALVRATSDRIMKEKAAMVGERIRSEDGVTNAIQFMSVYLPRAIRTAQHQAAESVEAQESLIGLGSASSSKEEDLDSKSPACQGGWRNIIAQC